jgi:hypothetical protein
MLKTNKGYCFFIIKEGKLIKVISSECFEVTAMEIRVKVSVYSNFRSKYRSPIIIFWELQLLKIKASKIDKIYNLKI